MPTPSPLKTPQVHQRLALPCLVLMSLSPSRASVQLARPHLLLMLLLMLAGVALASSASNTYQAPSPDRRRQLQATTNGEDVPITIDYDPAHGYDVGGPAPVCWRTSNSVTTRVAACPHELILTYHDPPPNPLYSMRDYISHFRVTVNEVALGVVYTTSAVTNQSINLVHANVHSCVATVGFCTPAIGNTPGLATHTPEKVMPLLSFLILCS